MAHKSTESTNEKQNENNIDTEKCIKVNKAQDTQLSRKRSKVGKKNRKHKVFSTSRSSTQVHTTCAPLPLLPTPYVSNMATYYPRNYSQPIPIDWNPIMAAIQVPTPMYTLPLQPVPVIVNPVVTTICPYTCTVPQIITPVAVHPLVAEFPGVTYTYEPTEVIYTDQVNETTVADETYYDQPGEDLVRYVEETIELQSQAPVDIFCTLQDNKITTYKEVTAQNSNPVPLETYLSLPRNLFSAPRMLTIDPNPIIDEFCKLENVHSHVPWLLDLEFGIPKIPITRQIPIYHVNFNSIHCKNTPDAIHPGFDSCSEEFKNVFLFYYDCMISSLYTGYVMLHCDVSIDNFQSWLLFPMQELGMCWP